MSERFSRLFTLPSSLYAAGAPVTISAGALLKDNQSGNIYAQLKFNSISNQRIKALHIIITPFDTAGQTLGDMIEYQYLDLNAERGAEFGQKVPIPMSDNRTRSFSVAVDEVIFQDNSKWRISNEAWESLPAPVSLADVYTDWNIQQQFQIDIGKNVRYFPTEHKDLWYCACGTLNHAEETACAKCGLELNSLLAANQPELLPHYEQRKVEEEAAAEKQAQQAKKRKKLAAIAVSIMIAVAAISIFSVKVLIPNHKYNQALAMIENGEYGAGIEALEAMGDYKDAPEQIAEAQRMENYANAEALLDETPTRAEIAKAAIAFAKVGDYKDARERSLALWDAAAVRETISSGEYHTVALKTDGTAIATDAKGSPHSNGQVAYDNDPEQCNVSGWTDIVATSAGRFHTVGLKVDGTVVAVGDVSEGQCSVSNWTDIVAVSANGNYTVGLKSDGTVVAIGGNSRGQCNVDKWTDIVAVSAGYYHTVGLKADGTVVAVGNNEFSQCDVSEWTDIRVPERGK